MAVRPVLVARFRRPLAGLLVAVLVGSLLSVVGAAGAANTVAEGSVDSAGKRVLAGADRYGTSVALARHALAGDAASQDEVVVVSGVTAVDAFAAVGLATARDAVVLLTEADELPRVVRRFINEQEFTQVTIVGGTAAVSAAVEDRLSRLETVTDVVRITGDDRFDTSAATATATGDPGVWCDSDETVAFMVGGSSLADGVAVAPVATKMAASVLLNPADELNPSVASVLEAQEVERVVVVGSEAEIGSAVADELAALGIEVTRVDGSSAAARSVALAKLVSGTDCDAVGVAPNQFAFVNGDAAAGAATLGTVLASAVVESGDLVPVLLVGDSLPAEVAAHLGSVPVKVGAAFQDIVLHAVGGTAAVTQAVIDAAITAGTTSDPIEVAITLRAGGDVIRMLFSDPISSGAALRRSNFKLNGSPLSYADRLLHSTSINPQEIRLSLGGYELRPGDVFEIVADSISGEFVADGSPRNDNRTVGYVRVTVPGDATAVDRTRPRLAVTAPEGSDTVRVLIVNDDTRAADPQDMLNAADVTLTIGGTVVEVADDGTNTHGLGVFPDSRTSLVAGEMDAYRIRWGCVDDRANNCTGEIGGVATQLAAGDRVAIAAGGVVDESGNANRSTIVRVSANSSDPALSGSPVLEAPGRVQARADVSVSYNGGRSYVQATRWRFSFLPGSQAAGAIGNAWSLFVLKRADTEKEGEAPTIDVDVSVIEERKTIQVVFDDEATAADIGDVLEEELEPFMRITEFTGSARANDLTNFFNQQNINLQNDDGSGVSFTRGQTAITLLLTSREPLSEFKFTEFMEAQPAGSPFGDPAVTDGLESAFTGLAWPTPLAAIRYTYSDASVMPDGDETIVLPAGVMVDFEGNTNAERRNIRVRAAD